MSQLLRTTLLTLVVAVSAAAQPTITSISPATASRSSRVLIQGSGFGALQGSAQVTIAGITAPVTRWSDTVVAAYVPEAATIGGSNIQVFDSNGVASNVAPVTVT